ncbi:hypothetical protein NDU88_001936 [Pleurodeles waltl]|uniref:Uncharacterized protein n=1 Tax=Pleurodeles waltl TaxID=8319 RepID=A0AAV7VD68_PLEWA|nr:hypothetical protein NDU88_001936 [Pleurodeles waltl]
MNKPKQRLPESKCSLVETAVTVPRCHICLSHRSVITRLLKLSLSPGARLCYWNVLRNQLASRLEYKLKVNWPVLITHLKRMSEKPDDFVALILGDVESSGNPALEVWLCGEKSVIALPGNHQ